MVHNVELHPGRAQLARSAGTSAQLMARRIHLRLPRGVSMVLTECRATVGQVAHRT